MESKVKVNDINIGLSWKAVDGLGMWKTSLDTTSSVDRRKVTELKNKPVER